ncbi:hypothetical protein [Rhizobium sp. Leaf262]|nr:hypothetical protein [Rhizobium sp. Leaf262]
MPEPRPPFARAPDFALALWRQRTSEAVVTRLSDALLPETG